MQTVRSGWLRRRRASVAAVVVAICAFFAAAPAAEAHPYLVASTPQAGVVVSQAPTSIQIAFTEGLVIPGCAITITNQAGRRIAVRRITSALAGNAMVAKLPTLAEGIYTVSWVAAGIDGHTVEGSYKFGVPSAGGQAPPGAATLLATTTTSGLESAPTESLVSLVGRWLAILAAVALLGAATLLVRLRSRVGDAVVDLAQTRWVKLALPLSAVALIGSVAEALERASGPHGLNLALLGDSDSDISILVRLGVLAIGVVVLGVGARRRLNVARQVLLGGLVGALALAATAEDGHVSTVKSAPTLAVSGMVLHLLSVGVWLGAVIALVLVLVPAARIAGDARSLAAALRAYAPVAIAAAGVTAVTGVIAAVREVHRWYFLWWSGYGHILIVKVAIGVLIAAVGAAGAALARRNTGSRYGVTLLRIEAVLAVVALAAATLLAGTLQGRGQTLPSQRGNLLPGAGFADVAVTGAIGQVTLAPATIGLNHIIVQNVTPNQPGEVAPKPLTSAQVALACACGGQNLSLKATLHPGSAGPAGPWVATVGLPLDGTYTAELIEDGHPTVGSPTFTVGDIHTAGSTSVEVASVADLSGPDGADCRTQELGALIGIELMNASGGINGNKIHQVVLDDGGSAAVAREDALQLAAQHPVAFLDPCGQGAQAAVAAVGSSIPTIVADESVPVTQGRYVYRLAPNPHAEGYAVGQYIAKIGLPSEPDSIHRVAAFVGDTADSQARLAGLRAALEHYHIALRVFPGRGPALASSIASVLNQLKWLGIYADTDFSDLTNALETVSAHFSQKFEPAPIIVPQALDTERFILGSATLGAEGQIRGVTDVDPTTDDAQLYADLVPQVVGELATMPGLAGFVSAQALAYGLVKGDSLQAISARLDDPGVFSTIATAPWETADPADGTQVFKVMLAEFLPDNLIPPVNGGPSEPYEGDFFTNGAWEQASPGLFSPINLGKLADGTTL